VNLAGKVFDRRFRCSRTSSDRFHDQLCGPNRTVKLHNAGATGAVTRVYKDGTSEGFLIEPPYQSGWYEDAVLTGNKNQFAAVRLVRPGQGQAVLDWVSFK
jgi:hypothetical protein